MDTVQFKTWATFAQYSFMQIHLKSVRIHLRFGMSLFYIAYIA